MCSFWLLGTLAIAQGYQIGNEATGFTLKNVDGKMVSLSDFKKSKGVVVIFTCNHCPYAVAYEDRIVAIDKKYKALGFPVVAINPNDAAAYPTDSFEAMQKRAADKAFTFPYLIDETQQIAKAYGATKTPHVYVIQNSGGKWIVKYIGAIDDNYQDAAEVKEPFLTNALDALLGGEAPATAETKAVGCSIKWKK